MIASQAAAKRFITAALTEDDAGLSLSYLPHAATSLAPIVADMLTTHGACSETEAGERSTKISKKGAADDVASAGTPGKSKKKSKKKKKPEAEAEADAATPMSTDEPAEKKKKKSHKSKSEATDPDVKSKKKKKSEKKKAAE